MKLFGTYDIKAYVREYLESLRDLEWKVFVDLPAGSGVMAQIARQHGARVEAYDLFPEVCTVPGLEGSSTCPIRSPRCASSTASFDRGGG